MSNNDLILDSTKKAYGSFNSLTSQTVNNNGAPPRIIPSVPSIITNIYRL